LELSLAEPTPPVPQSKTFPEQKVQPIQHKTVQPTPQFSIVKEAKFVEEVKPQPQITEPIVETKPIETPQPMAQVEPKITPPAPQPIVPQVNAQEQYLDDHLSTIRDILVKYRKYPSQAVRLKQEGSVKVTFRLKHNGEVEDIRVVGSSGYDILDNDALKLIQKSAEYFPKPPQSVRITVPLHYALKVRS
jgi:periplasmic protein TonB